MTKDREFVAINRRQKKVEAEAKATGACQFTGNVYLPGMLHAKVLRSPIAYGPLFCGPFLFP